MRATAILLAGAATLAVTLALDARAGEGEPDAPAEVHRAVVPGVAADGTPQTCRTDDPEPCPLPVISVTVTSADGARAVTLTVEVASRADQRQRGLMFRESLDEYAGMLFLFGEERSGGFWMRNTLIPLDIAYLAADGTVLEIVHGVPLSLDALTPTRPYRSTLEVNGGWFARHGFGAGDVVVRDQWSVGGGQ